MCLRSGPGCLWVDLGLIRDTLLLFGLWRRRGTRNTWREGGGRLLGCLWRLSGQTGKKGIWSALSHSPACQLFSCGLWLTQLLRELHSLPHCPVSAVPTTPRDPQSNLGCLHRQRLSELGPNHPHASSATLSFDLVRFQRDWALMREALALLFGIILLTLASPS